MVMATLNNGVPVCGARWVPVCRSWMLIRRLEKKPVTRYTMPGWSMADRLTR